MRFTCSLFAHTALVRAGLLTVALLSTATAQQTSDSNFDREERILVKRRSAANQPTAAISLKNGQRLRKLRGDSSSYEVLTIPAGTDREAALRELRARADIEYAVPDRRRRAQAVPNDLLFASQWYLQNDPLQPAAIAATTAWDITKGSNGIVVAVLDTGVRFDHPDLYPSAQAGKLLPGFDFVDNPLAANDGDGWDPDPSDPGDWISQADLNRSDNYFDECGGGDLQDTPTNSSWHGTRVAGLIAARSNDNASTTDPSPGIAGTSWSTYILPVRVLGKCGGHDGDIIDAMRWAAGIPVSGAPANPYPAKIINMSLGGEGVCTAAYQNVIEELTQLGVSVVISAGNNGGPVSEPANCPGAIAVAGLRHAGTKVGFSSLGPEIALSAPGGNCVNTTGVCLFPLNTTSDVGTTTPAGPTYTDGFNISVGTSFSAPLVSGVIALMRSVNDKLSTTQIRQRLRAGTSPFPTNGAVPTCHLPSSPTDLQTSECVCTTAVCGAGMLYAPGAVAEAQRPIAYIAQPLSVSPGAPVTLDGSSSVAACNRTIVNFAWSVVGTNGTTTPVISNDSQANANVTAPSSGSFTLRLTVTDDQGAADFTDITISPINATITTGAISSAPACPVAVVPPLSQPIPGPTPPTVSAPDKPKAGGGGSMSLWWLAMLLLAGSYFSISRTRSRKY